MTGLTPFVHGFRRSEDAFPRKAQTLAEYMRDAGYQTGAVGYNYHLAKHLAPALARGFGTYDIHPTAPKPRTLAFSLVRELEPRAYLGRWKTPHLTEGARSWLARTTPSESFFFWLHYFDPHAPYAPPADLAPEGEPDPLIGPATVNTLHVDALVGAIDITPDRLSWIRRLYEAEVRYVDAHIGRTLETLDELGLYEDSLIVTTSDHGEEFFEHGHLDHGHSLYDPLLRVPLMVKLPRRMRDAAYPHEVEEHVSNIAVTPTVLDLAGVPHDPGSFSAASLATDWRGESAEPRAVFSTGIYAGQQQQAVSFGRWKYIRGEHYPVRELYDVEADPLESVELSRAHPDVVQEADRLLNSHLEQAARLRRLHGLETAEKADFDRQDIENLRSLGYVH